MSTQKNPIKVLITKTSLDGHWRGPLTVTSALRDAGMEVIYGGMLNPFEIVAAAMQEDVDVLGLNIGGRYNAVRLVMEQLQEKGMDDILVVAGGTIPREDIPTLKEMGIAEVFPPGSTVEAIIDFIRNNASPRKYATTG